MKTLRHLLPTTLLLLFLLGSSTPATAAYYEFTPQSPSAIFLPAAQQRDMLASDDQGRLYMLGGDGHMHKQLQIRDANGVWGTTLDTTINPYLDINAFILNPNTGNPIVLGVEPVPADEDEEALSIVVGYEFDDGIWAKTTFELAADGSPSAFDYDESGTLHFLYRDRISTDLYYGRYDGGVIATHEVTSLPSSSYSDFAIQASSAGSAPIRATVYDPSGFIFSSVSTNEGLSWGFATVVDYGFTPIGSLHNLSTELDGDQVLHVFYRVIDGSYSFVNHRTVNPANELSAITPLNVGAYGWSVFLYDNRPHYLHGTGFLGAMHLKHLTNAGWADQTVNPGTSFNFILGAEVVGDVFYLSGTINSGDDLLYLGKPAPMFEDGFE